jgi:predicted NAD/FAD-dependent oxidoreductase
LDVANGGFGGFDPFNGTGAAVVTQLVAYNIADETQNEAYSVDFVYTAGDIIGIAFGSYNAAGTFDNVVIAVPEPSTYALLAGCFALASVMIRRRR